jgi:hypothetical protein
MRCEALKLPFRDEGSGIDSVLKKLWSGANVSGLLSLADRSGDISSRDNAEISSSFFRLSSWVRSIVIDDRGGSESGDEAGASSNV